MRTWLMQRFGLTVPVVSAPMAGAAGGRLAAAVSTAGALGMIGVPRRPDPAWLDHQLDLAEASGRAFGVGLVGWHLDGPADQVLAQVLARRPAMVSVSYPFRPDLVEVLHDAGCTVATQAGTVAEVRAAGEDGADLIVARGAEGGGHGRDAVSTLVLLQQVLAEVDAGLLNRPVLAAGGIATGRGLAAVLAAGAAGAWVGTAFLACPEADTRDGVRTAILRAGADATTYSRVFDLALGTPWPAQFGSRTLTNAVTRSWAHRTAELEAGGPDAARLADEVRAAHRDGDPEHSAATAGQAAGLVHHARSAAEVVAELARHLPTDASTPPSR